MRGTQADLQNDNRQTRLGSPELKAEQAKQGRGDIMMVVGGLIPPQDFQALLDASAAAIFPPAR